MKTTFMNFGVWQNESKWANFQKLVIVIFTFSIKKTFICWNDWEWQPLKKWRNENDENPFVGMTCLKSIESIWRFHKQNHHAHAHNSKPISIGKHVQPWYHNVRGVFSKQNSPTFFTNKDNFYELWSLNNQTTPRLHDLKVTKTL